MQDEGSPLIMKLQRASEVSVRESKYTTHIYTYVANGSAKGQQDGRKDGTGRNVL